MKIRYYLALWMAKLSIIALKATKHNATNFPGIVALKICPKFLELTKKPDHIIGITGTNGKTTISNLLVDMLRADGEEVMDNNYGSNTITGIITSFIYATDNLGKIKYDRAVLEIDERSVRVLFNAIKPEYLLINNLTRDSIMRNAHPEFIAKLFTKHMPENTRLILNGDDIIASGVAPTNDRVYFGIDKMDTDVPKCINLINDMQICPKCGSLLRYEYLRYHHIGKAFCPNCKFKTPPRNYIAQNVNTKKMTFEMSDSDGKFKYRLLNDSVFNIYNVVALVAIMRELGYKPERIAELLDSVEIVATRYKVTEIGKNRVIKQMSKEKNALASSRVFDYISNCKGRKELILMMNCLGDEQHWSENICWMYDCDFEFLNDNDIVNVVCTGPRAKDYYLRLRLAGVPEDRISLEPDEYEARHALKLKEPVDVYLLYGTDSLTLAEKILPLVEDEVRERGIK